MRIVEKQFRLKKSIWAVLVLAALIIVCHQCAINAAPASLPTGMTEFITDPSEGKDRNYDSGYPTHAADVSGDYLWIGRNGGLRKYNKKTGEWIFFKYDPKVCPGNGTINIVADPPFIWARLTSSGALCRLNTVDGSWHTLNHWTVLNHTGTGYPFTPTKSILYVAGSGGPDWEGVSLIDRSSEEWIKLLKTKAPSAMYVDKDNIWLGVPEGILRINRITEEYLYFQPPEHGGGAIIKDIIPIPGGLAFATMGDRTGVLGDKLKIFKTRIQVFNKRQNKWYTYGRNERDSIVRDIQAGKIFTNSIKTNPGLLLYRGGKWTLLNKKTGLSQDEILDLDKDEKFIYVSTINGITVLDLKTLKPVVLNYEIFNTIRQVRKLIVEEKYVWAFTPRKLFRIDKRLLFSSPR